MQLQVVFFTGYGLVAHCEEPMYLHGNAFHANKSGGISIKQTGPVGIYDNSITCNAGTGIHIIPSAKVSRNLFIANYFLNQ